MDNSSISIGTPEWEELTAERWRLIQKKSRGTISDTERIRLEQLNQISITTIEREIPWVSVISEDDLRKIEQAFESSKGEETK